MIKTLYKCFQHWSEKGSVYLISDTHFDDIDCKLMDKNWITPEEHIKKLSTITKNDTLIHLGDVGNPEYLNKLKCRKVLIMGNHDQSSEKFKLYFNEIYSGPLMIAEKLIISHEPLNINWAFKIHGHDHNKVEVYREDCKHLNLAANVCNYTPVSLGKIIKDGILADIPSIHRMTIDRAITKKEQSEFVE